MIILQPNTPVARALHPQLYTCIYTFAEEITPEYPPELVTNHWLSQFYMDSKAIRIGVTLEDYSIVSHAVYNQTLVFDVMSVCLNQVKADKKDKTFLDEAMEYLDKYAVEVGATFTSFVVKKNTAALKKKYGYEDVRSVMYKYLL